MTKRACLLVITGLSLTLPVIAATDPVTPAAADGASSAIPTIDLPVNQQSQFDADISRYHPANEILWLGTQSDNQDNRFLTLWRQHTSATVIGSSWLFADNYNSADSPNFIQTLRKQLNSKGLDSYSVSPLSIILDSSVAQQQLLSQLSLLQTHNDSIQPSVSVAKRLLIAQGRYGEALLQLLAANPALHIDAIVLLDAYSNTPEARVRTANLVATTPLPILDLYNKADNGAIQVSAAQRNTASTRGGKHNYRQSAIIGLPQHAETQLATSQTIYGWLISLGWYSG